MAFLALVTFLGINGLELDAAEPEVVTTMLTLADARLSEEQLAVWIRTRVVRSK